MFVVIQYADNSVGILFESFLQDLKRDGTNVTVKLECNTYVQAETYVKARYPYIIVGDKNRSYIIKTKDWKTYSKKFFVRAFESFDKAHNYLKQKEELEEQKKKESSKK